MIHVMQFDQVLAAYRLLLVANPGKALLIRAGGVAIIEDGCVFGAALGLDGSPEVVARTTQSRDFSYAKVAIGTAKLVINCFRVSLVQSLLAFEALRRCQIYDHS